MRQALRMLLVTALLGGLLVAERRWPLRRRTQPTALRGARNLAVALTGGIGTACAEAALGWPAARRDTPAANTMPGRVMRFGIRLLLLDYTLYLWHRLNHRLPLLWRCHIVHHLDRDLDTLTGIRFHFGELALSAGLRWAQVRVLGVDRATLVMYQLVLLASVLFHHSNLRLPVAWERRLVPFLVTPRMHGIHHSIVEAETHSNFSSLLTGWDWLHGTLRLNVPQAALTIGVPAYPDEPRTPLTALLALPFQPQRSSWEWPDGGRPTRAAVPSPRAELLP